MSEMRPFSWSDPFLMSEVLSEDERMIQDAAAAFAEAELAPRVADAYLGETVEPELFRLMGKAGLLGVTLPENWPLILCDTERRPTEAEHRRVAKPRLHRSRFESRRRLAPGASENAWRTAAHRRSATNSGPLRVSIARISPSSDP